MIVYSSGNLYNSLVIVNLCRLQLRPCTLVQARRHPVHVTDLVTFINRRIDCLAVGMPRGVSPTPSSRNWLRIRLVGNYMSDDHNGVLISGPNCRSCVCSFCIKASAWVTRVFPTFPSPLPITPQDFKTRSYSHVSSKRVRKIACLQVLLSSDIRR